jgi:SAM-dependent methyltransferase
VPVIITTQSLARKNTHTNRKFDRRKLRSNVEYFGKSPEICGYAAGITLGNRIGSQLKRLLDRVPLVSLDSRHLCAFQCTGSNSTTVSKEQIPKSLHSLFRIRVLLASSGRLASSSGGIGFLSLFADRVFRSSHLAAAIIRSPIACGCIAVPLYRKEQRTQEAERAQRMKSTGKFLRRLFFNLWYFFNPPWDTGISPLELMEYIQSHPPGRALDMGCGTGTNVITLAKHGWQATGVDFAIPAVRNARKKASEAGVEVDFYIDDVTRLEHISGEFDLVLDMGCFHSLSSDGRQKYMHKLTRVLAPSGAFLVYVFFKDTDEEGAGVSEADLKKLEESLELEWRQNGTERGRRPSAWLQFCRPQDEPQVSEDYT